jgi:hypothetical protein
MLLVHRFGLRCFETKHLANIYATMPSDSHNAISGDMSISSLLASSVSNSAKSTILFEGEVYQCTHNRTSHGTFVTLNITVAP